MPGIILMVAAEAREFDGLTGRRATRSLGWDLQFARETELNGKRAVLVAHGAGMRMAGLAADVARRSVCPEAVVSTGYCGALDPQLYTGDLFVASSVIDREHGVTYPCATGDLAPCERGAATRGRDREAACRPKLEHAPQPLRDAEGTPSMLR